MGAFVIFGPTVIELSRCLCYQWPMTCENTKLSISKEEINALSLLVFPGEIAVICDKEHCDQVVKSLMEEEYLGFDTECRPSFKKGESHDTALLQLATEDRAYLFRLNLFSPTDSLLELLSAEHIKKVGVAVADDIKGLQRLRSFSPRGFVEIGELAKRHQIKQLGLRSLAAIMLGKRVSKSAQLSNWEARGLSEGQLCYAATDAWAGLKLYKTFIGLT